MCAILAIVACSALAGEAADEARPRPSVPNPSAAEKSAKAAEDASRDTKAVRKDPEEAAIENLLQRKVSFELSNTPFNEAVSFVVGLAEVEMLVFHPMTEVKTPMSIKVTDCPIADPLTALCKIAGAQWEIRKSRIHVTALPKPPAVAGGDARPTTVSPAGRDAGATPAAPASVILAATGRDAGATTSPTGPTNRLRVRLANGTEIEAEGEALAQFRGDILDAFFDPARDGLLAWRLPREHAAGLLPALRLRLAESAGKCKLDYDDKLDLLLITGEPAELRRAATLLRSLGLNGLQAADERISGLRPGTKKDLLPARAPARPAAADTQ